MPTKYVRDEEMRETPFIRNLRGRGTWPRRRVLLVYVGAFVVVVVILLSNISRRTLDYYAQPVLRGEGIVTAKEIDESPRDGPVRRLHVKVQLQQGRWASDRFPMDRTHWEAFREGDRIGVLYQTNRSGKRIRLREVGLVALPPSNR